MGDWGLGIGDWGIGDWGLGPIPNPQSPIPNPHLYLLILIIKSLLFLVVTISDQKKKYFNINF